MANDAMGYDSGLASPGSSASSDQDSGPMPVLLFMGKTGAGKSSMIRLIGGKDVNGSEPPVDGGLESCTFKSCTYEAEIDNKKVHLIDTPGFDDSSRDNLEILREIASQLHIFSLKESDVEIRGVVFLHDISEGRLGGSQRKTWEILKGICGKSAMENVVVGTTMWGPPGSGKFLAQEKRENELKDNHWVGIHKVTQVKYDDRGNAVEIVKDLLARPSVLLQVQEEMRTPPHTIETTTAGLIAMPEGLAEKMRIQKEYEEQQKKNEEETRQREEAIMKKQKEDQRKLEEEQKRQREEDEKRKKEQLRIEEDRRIERERQRRRDEEELRRLREEAEEKRRRAEQEARRIREEYEQRRMEEMRKKEEEFRRRQYEARRQEEERQRQWQIEADNRRREQEEELWRRQRQIDEENRRRNSGGCCIQ